MAKKKTGGKDSALTDAARKLGHAGGLKGGDARAKKLTAKERSDIAAMGGKAKAAKEGTKGKKKTDNGTSN